MVEERPARGQALAILRSLRGWSQQELAEAAGLTRATIGGYEQGTQALTLRKLWKLARVMGHSKEKVRDVLRLFRSPAIPSERWVGPVRFTAAEERALRDFGDQESRRMGFTLRKLLTQARVQEATVQDRKMARQLWVNLRAECRLRKAIQEKPEYQTWAISELLCEESIQAAPSRPDRALELAEAAVLAAELAPGEERWRLRVLGYAQAHIGNAWRVIEQLEKAESCFHLSRINWATSADSDPMHLLNEGRLFGLEASLLREQHRLSAALELLCRGLAVSNKDEKGYLLINKAKVFETAEDFEGAITALREAAPQICPSAIRLKFVLRFDLAVNLCHLRRFAEVEPFLPELRRLAIQLCKGLEQLRVRWLEGWVASGVGRLEEGVERLSVVREEFMECQLTYEAALVSMDLADALLQLRRLAQVKGLTKQMAPIFTGRGLPEKALEALLLFKKAVEDETATVDLVRGIREFLRKTRGRPNLKFTLSE